MLQLGKGRLALAVPDKAARRSFILSAFQLTDLRGQLLRRWLRKVATFHNAL